ncbi:MAG: glycosyltransferase family 9 protein, partial [Deltaproteobacteria bacterium]|nr:glycosyltransferase family 9 protein [Deltaproteobacteria bacterium]
MAEKPILIIQMQRLGDMVLTYPLMGWLARMHPRNPIWVVGEKHFFSELMDFSPDAVYFEHSASQALRQNAFHTVINISHRPEAMELAGSLDTDELVGAYVDKKSRNRFIRGDWQLYRASLTNNNRYNLFHWADMNALDSVSPRWMQATLWPQPQARKAGSSAHIGLFLGASEKDKHPDADFWTALARDLLAAGHKPALLGGAGEKSLGDEVARGLCAPALNLTDRFSLRELCRFIGGLDLFVTPDTGPMHLAAWTGVPVLNLSVGPVNAWETGPFSPGNFVLRAALPCTGCWHCTQAKVACKDCLNPGHTARLIHEILAREDARLARLDFPGQELLRTARDAHNLYQLCRVTGDEQPRQITALFWQAFFGHTLGSLPGEALEKAWRSFAEGSPGNVPAFAKALVKLSRDISAHFRSGHASPVAREDFWASFPLPLRPLTSFLHLKLQNGLFRHEAFTECLGLVERLIALF